ncbi:MAG TPA: TlpA disulfide reductase family protein [Streptosporangiaceae bacterium]|nr:TlpA disulfide reductase family protein [Streptosporangiaceae bacterium]
MVVASLLAAVRRAGPARVAPAVVVAGALLAAGCSSSSPPAGTTSLLNPGTTVFTAATAPHVPRVSGELLGGGKLSLTAYRGHVLVLNFWGSWCTVCREEASALTETAQRFHSSGVRFLGVDVADNTASAEAFMRNFKITYPSLSDPGDKIALSFNRVIPVSDFPSTLVISPGGRITGRIIGKVSTADLASLIKAAEKQR